MHHLPISKKSQGAVFCNHEGRRRRERRGEVLGGAPLLVWSYLGVSEKQSVALNAGPVVGERMSARNHTPRAGCTAGFPVHY